MPVSNNLRLSSYDRIGRGSIDIDAAVVSMIGTIPPSWLAEYVRSAVRGGSGDDGLIQRFQLAVWPDCPSKWRNVDRWPDSAAKKQVFDLVCGLDELAADKAGAIQGEDDDFPYLRFAPDAQAVFEDWLTKLETRLRGDELVPAMESHLAKYRSLIPSLALLIHLADGGVAVRARSSAIDCEGVREGKRRRRAKENAQVFAG